ncbi:hypothetical protein A3A20_01635 [Candidatus Wolfebacteria bacterium RIFCSPLOWO2_01_FULL_45_19]|uniref:Type II secretion system protein GspG C-terminal domain-containing protein n=1 Tax=Candidatus Wolfebacteria bacterium RIFCSPLOWO2_01_FULL_45_19 TaxID=1802557 RepID=A0A1F8DSM3_9BACT|nr:MAG: hypothetical protein UX23_C0002G0032 [Parcubacteria group bacterium GW2011_GWB1_45_9]OGM91621.1 MAG: hypothetical protein A3A20_01635 [Candidatus Wolfebacteria bacterium RIFCSPLOWO2_01_FULL_45_19]
MKGFTLLEILISIAILGILIGIVFPFLISFLETSKTVEAGQRQRVLTVATEFYFIDMGFFPPDVNRGWDPGFVRPLPWNADEEAGEPPPGGFASPGTNCNHCPTNWETLVQERWKGPYIPEWPRFTPWKGKYDYNYWGSGAIRFGCNVPPGIYAGVQGDYYNNNKISGSSENKMIVNGFDHDGCLNGESQMLLWSLEN